MTDKQVLPLTATLTLTVMEYLALAKPPSWGKKKTTYRILFDELLIISKSPGTQMQSIQQR